MQLHPTTESLAQSVTAPGPCPGAVTVMTPESGVIDVGLVAVPDGVTGSRS